MVNYKNKLSAPLANSFQKGVIAMEIRFAETRDIPGMINLLLQVGEVHHRIRPDLFRAGAQKYDEQTLARMLTDDTRPIFVAVEDGKVLGYFPDSGSCSGFCAPSCARLLSLFLLADIVLTG